MSTRALLGLAGLGIGVAVGMWTVRRTRPPASPTGTGGAAAPAPHAPLGERLLRAIAVGREAAAAREAELRAQYGVAAAGSRHPRDHGVERHDPKISPYRPTTTDPVT